MYDTTAAAEEFNKICRELFAKSPRISPDHLFDDPKTKLTLWASKALSEIQELQEQLAAKQRPEIRGGA